MMLLAFQPVVQREKKNVCFTCFIFIKTGNKAERLASLEEHDSAETTSDENEGMKEKLNEDKSETTDQNGSNKEQRRRHKLEITFLFRRK